jgi:hypothetical protein
LAALLIAAAPVLFFILVLFEPSGHERYFALFVVLFLALGSVVGSTVQRPRPLLQGVLVLFLVILMPSNAKSYIELRRSTTMDAALQRIQAVRRVMTPNSVLVLLSFRDGISQFLERFPFHPAVREALTVHDLIEPGTLRTLHWRMEFAQRSLGCWEHGGEVWISRRLFAQKPLPEWNWVEAHDRRVKWTDLPEFFGKFTTDQQVAGDDGFVHLAHSEANRQLLLMAAH